MVAGRSVEKEQGGEVTKREVNLCLEISEDSILDRWARRIVRVVDSRSDPMTLRHWSCHVYMSVGALRQLCGAAGVRPKISLDLARVLRAVVWLQEEAWIPEAVLNCRDPRTLDSLLSRTGIRQDLHRTTLAPTPQVLFERQRLLPQGGPHLHALQRALSSHVPGADTMQTWKPTRPEILTIAVGFHGQR